MTIKVPHTGGFGIREVEIPGPFKTLAEIKLANHQRKERGLQGGEYWGRSEVRFFDSKPARSVLYGRFVIDSRQFHDERSNYHAPREWSVVMATDDGEIDKLAFPPDDWDGEIAQIPSKWKEHFTSPETARLALKLFVQKYGANEILFSVEELEQ